MSNISRRKIIEKDSMMEHTDSEKQALFRAMVCKYFNDQGINIILNEMFKLELNIETNPHIKQLFESDKLLRVLYSAWIEPDNDQAKCIVSQYQ